MSTHQGRCHCGNVEFQVETQLDSAFTCNCSFCIRRAATLQKVNDTEFNLLSNPSKLGEYGSRDFSKHYFCKTCGIQCFTRIQRGDSKSVAVNIACLEDVDVKNIKSSLFDGATKL